MINKEVKYAERSIWMRVLVFEPSVREGRRRRRQKREESCKMSGREEARLLLLLCKRFSTVQRKHKFGEAISPDQATPLLLRSDAYK